MPERPNVVVVMTDQHRADHCAREGFPLDTTPFLDGLARRGTWFDRAYTSTPVCAPARTSFLTGRFPTATRVWTNGQQDAAVYDRDLVDALDDAGYRTALVGKNHSCLDADRLDHAVEYGHWGATNGAAEARRTESDEAFEAWLSETALFEGGGGFSLDPTPFPVETQCAPRCVDAATDWLDSLAGDDPFFLWLSLPEPHNPYQVPEPYHSLFSPDDLPPVDAGPSALEDRPFAWRWLRDVGVARARREAPDADYDAEVVPRLRAIYCGMLRMVDDQVRRFVEALSDRGLRDDTLLVFVGDHGDFVGQYGLMRKGVGVPEATARIPLLFDGPGVDSSPDGGPNPAHVSIVDLLPTICDAAGAPVPDGVQGRSLWPVLGDADGAVPPAFESVYAESGSGGAPATPESVPPLDEASKNELNAHTQAGRTAMVRRGDWKLVVDAAGDPALYDVTEDPAETNDLAGDPAHADRLRDLLATFSRWSLAVRDTLPDPYDADADPRARVHRED